jgi:hypothetical protein
MNGVTALFFVTALTLVVFVGAFVWGLCTSAKAEDEALHKALYEYLKSKETK